MIGVEIDAKHLFFFGMLKRDEKSLYASSEQLLSKDIIVYIRIFSDLENSPIFSDYCKAYDGLAPYGAKEYFRVKHCENEVSLK